MRPSSAYSVKASTSYSPTYGELRRSVSKKSSEGLPFDSVLASAVPKSQGKFAPVLSTAAAFLFVNQLLFYSILARETNLYEQIDPAEMSSPHLIRSKYFAKVS